MKKQLVFLCPGLFFGCLLGKSQQMDDIATFADVQALLSNDVSHIRQLILDIQSSVPGQVQKIVAIPDAQRTFANTAQAIDDLIRQRQVILSVLELLMKVSPDEQVLACSRRGCIELEQFWQENLTKNVALFNAFKAYADGAAKTEKLNAQERYFVQEMMRAYLREGLSLPTQQLAEVKALTSELTQLMAHFDANIADVTTQLVCTPQQLAGVPESVLVNLKTDEQGRFLVGLDYATFYPVLTHAIDEQTRKAVYLAFENRAYPTNYDLLVRMIAKRDELAHRLGFATYAVYDLETQMAKKPDVVQNFLQSIIDAARQIHGQEFTALTTHLPASVTLTADGKIKPWDLLYLKEAYRQQHFKINDAQVSEYFPVEHVLHEMCAIYQQFLGLQFQQLSHVTLWHESVQCFAVRNADDHKLRGYLLFDLYPRPHKFSHACMQDIPAQTKCDGSLRPAVVTIIVNFAPPTNQHPGLLRFADVETLFHEFGHAMHAMVGATQMASFAPTNTYAINLKFDFVELPSQLFEQWLKDSSIIKRLSCHYQTKLPLPDELAALVTCAKKIDVADFALFVAGKSKLDLLLHAGITQDIQTLYKDITTKSRPYLFFDDTMHMPASWGHLTEYAAKHYCYLWSYAYALDVFSVIKRDGLLNPAVGKRLVRDVLGRGGSADPMDLLHDFLGRGPNAQAYIQYMQQ